MHKIRIAVVIVDSIVCNRWFYWTDRGINTIERASMDGSTRMVLHETNLRDPYALTINYDEQMLYWADFTLNKIESSYVDGSL